MSSIEHITQLLQPALPVPVPVPAPAVQANTALPSAASAVTDFVEISNAKAANQAVQSRAPIANTEILGTGTFSLFTVGNVLYTRQTERNPDGSVKVTYVPKYPASASATGGLDIEA